MTLKELIQRAVDIASKGQDTAPTRLAMEAAAEPLLPTTFQKVGEMLAARDNTRHLLRRTKQLSVVDGAVALDPDVLTSCIHSASLRDPADRTKNYSLAPWNQLSTGELDPRLGHFALEGDTDAATVLHVVEPGDEFDPDGGETIDLLLNIPCIPVIPANIDDDIAAAPEVLTHIIIELAAALRG